MVNACIKQKYYITECPSEVYDEIWKERCSLEVSYKIINNEQHIWTEVDEGTLISHAALACIGIQSESFYFDHVRFIFVYTTFHYCVLLFISIY